MSEPLTVRPMSRLRPMKIHVFAAIACALHCSCLSGQEEEWKSDPLLKGLRIGSTEAINEYRFWVEEWSKGKRVVDSEAEVINRLTEGYFYPLSAALAIHPHEEILRELMMFVALEVPTEFDAIWRFILIEIRNLDSDLAKEIDQISESRGVPSMMDRAMNRTGAEQSDTIPKKK